MRARSGTFWRALGATLVVLGAASPALAQGPTVRFRAPPGCPDESAVRREIEALLGRPLASVPGELEVDAEVVEADGRWLLRLRAGDVGERDIAGESCAALAQAAALMVGFMIDPSAETIVPALSLPRTEAGIEESTPPASAQAALELAAPRDPETPDAAPSAAEQLADPDAVAAGVGSRISIGFGPTFVLDVGTLPSLTAGVGGEVLVRYDRLDLRLRGHWLAPQRAALAENAMLPGLDAGVETELAQGSFHACGRPLERGLPALSLCGGIAMGAIFATGYGVSDARSEAGFFTAAVLGAAVPWEVVSELDLEIGVEASLPFLTPTFVFTHAGDELAVFTPFPISGRLTITGHIDVR